METGKSKAKRVVFWGVVGVLTFLLAGYVAANTGSYLEAPFETNGVLAGQSTVDYVFSNATHEVPITHSGATYSWTQPSGAHDAWVFTNLTAGDLQGAGVSQLTLTASAGNHTGNVTLGFGTSVGNFVGFSVYDNANLSDLVAPISPSYLTGNQSAPLALHYTSTLSAYSFTVSARGLNGIGTVFGPWVVENIGYVLATAAITVAAVLSMIWIDVDTNKVGPRALVRKIRARKRGRKRPAGRRA